MSFIGNLENSQKEEIKQKYITLIKTLHPDKVLSKNLQSYEIYLSILEDYKVLNSAFFKLVFFYF